MQVHAKERKDWGPCCNKLFASHYTPCRKKACLVDGFGEVDKLKKSIEVHTRKLAGSPTAQEAAEPPAEPEADEPQPMEE
jgi:hypothetical protein